MSKTKHRVYLELEVDMEEMDGDANSSAEILLELDVLGKVVKLLEDEGFDARIGDYVFAEEVTTP